MATLAGYGAVDVELTFGRAGVGSADVLTTEALGDTPAVEADEAVVIPAMCGLLLLWRGTGVLAGGGCCGVGFATALAGGG